MSSSILGIHLHLLIGPPLPLPLPASPELIQSVKQIEVTNTDEGRDGFEITFGIGRSGPQDLLNYKLPNMPQLAEGSRVIITMFFGVVPKVLIDGIITMRQLESGSGPGEAVFKVTGEDLSYLMDREEVTRQRPNMSDPIVVADIISSYMQYGIVPKPSAPALIDVPIMIDRIPTQRSTDYEHVQNAARLNGFVFYIEPGLVPGTSIAYWGPPESLGLSQRALNVNMGADTNVTGAISFQENPLDPVLVEGNVQDRLTGQSVPIATFGSTQLPMSLKPAWIMNYGRLKKERPRPYGGVSAMQAMAQAQGRTNSSSVSVVRGTGELDAVRYGDLLRARKPVDVRGVGLEYDGTYYVKSVTHKIKRGEYKQSFVITRDGRGTLIPGVTPSL